MRNRFSEIWRVLGLWMIVSVSHAGDLTVQRLAIFGFSDDDPQPTSLIQGSDGSLYGTTRGAYRTGGSSNGTVFKLSPAGDVTILASFDPSGTNGCCPGALVQAPDGSFYGATSSRGAGAHGSIFHLAANGELRLVFSFGAGHGTGLRVLIYGTDGHLYGTTTDGGDLGYGAIFKVTTSGQMTTLFSFSRTNGINPTSLVRAGDGTLFGTTSDWIGINAPDTVFKLSPSGEFAILASSIGSGPARPYSLVLGTNGDLYGVDRAGGTNHFGSIFKITPAGAMTTLAEFNGTNGWDPDRLIQGVDGSFYGTTVAGGSDYAGSIPGEDGFVASGSGTIFKMALDGEVTRLASLTEMPGDDVVGFLQRTDGILYGARTSGEFPQPAGIFRVVQGPEIIGLKRLEGRDVLTWKSFEGGLYQVERKTSWLTPWTPLSPTTVAATQRTAATNLASSSPQQFYRVRLLP